MSEWRPIETAPHDRAILLYWPRYAYSRGETETPLIAIGAWKLNPRLTLYSDDAGQHRKHDADAIAAELRANGMAEAYFSDNDEQDDFGLAERCHAPTHWMPLPPPPEPAK